MARSFQHILFGAACSLLLAASAGAQWRPFGGDPGRRPAGAYERGGPVRRTLGDLDRAAARAYVDRHERKHFDHARSDLMRFEERWARGAFDRGKLDGAIENIQHLVDSRQVNPRDRQILARDLYELRAFRSDRGYSYGFRRY